MEFSQDVMACSGFLGSALIGFLYTVSLSGLIAFCMAAEICAIPFFFIVYRPRTPNTRRSLGRVVRAAIHADIAKAGARQTFANQAVSLGRASRPSNRLRASTKARNRAESPPTSG